MSEGKESQKVKYEWLINVYKCSASQESYVDKNKTLLPTDKADFPSPKR